MKADSGNSHIKPITLVGGYLGAGKTTLINRLLTQPELPSGTAILVNDFGDINIDESLIRSESDNGNIIGLSNGCICCSISDDLSQALDQLNALPIAQVILETSGVAEPARVWQHCHYPGFSPKATVVVVDAVNFHQRSQDKYVGQLVTAQTAQADLLVVSKTELNSHFQLDSLTPLMTSRDTKLIETILGWQREGTSGAFESRIPLLPTFSAQTWYQENAVSRESIEASLTALGSSVQRVKGWIETEAGVMQVDKVGADLSIKRLEYNTKPSILGLVFIFHVDQNAGESSNPLADWALAKTAS